MLRRLDMNKLTRGPRTFVCVCLPILLITISQASATTVALEDGTSEATFSISGSYATLTVGPVVNIDPNGCPGSNCNSAFWNVGLTIDFFGPTNDLLATDSATVSEDCTPSTCTVPRAASFVIPSSTTDFEIFNTVNVGGGWTYISASEFISAGNSEIAETPIPPSVVLFSVGLAMFGVFASMGRRSGKLGLRPLSPSLD